MHVVWSYSLSVESKTGCWFLTVVLPQSVIHSAFSFHAFTLFQNLSRPLSNTLFPLSPVSWNVPTLPDCTQLMILHCLLLTMCQVSLFLCLYWACCLSLLSICLLNKNIKDCSQVLMPCSYFCVCMVYRTKCGNSNPVKDKPKQYWRGISIKRCEKMKKDKKRLPSWKTYSSLQPVTTNKEAEALLEEVPCEAQVFLLASI